MSHDWLRTIGTLPRVIAEAMPLIGTGEVAGPGDNPVIMGWAAELGVAALGYRYTGDQVPWCGLLVALVARRAGKPVPAGPLYALNWVTFGTAVAARGGFSTGRPLIFEPGAAASLGDVLVFRRPGGGHVGFYIGEDASYYYVLGGNQSDSVGFTWIAKARCVAVRRPPYTQVPASVRPFRLTRSGAISENEA